MMKNKDREIRKSVLSGGSAFRSLISRKGALASMIVAALYLGIAVFAECYSAWCSHKGTEPVYQIRNESIRNQPPSPSHLLGTDYLGRDVFLRAVFASRTAVKVGIIASLIATVCGVALGILSGYFGGTADDIIVWIYSTFAAMPSLLFILAFALLVSKGFLSGPLKTGFDAAAHALRTEPGMLAVYLGIGLTGWVGLCRVVRGEAMRLRSVQYVQAAKTLGVSTPSILFRYILPNLMHIVIIYFTMQFAMAIMTEVIVSYLGLGVQFEPSWGTMIADGQEHLWRGIWWEAGAATLFLFLLVLSLNILGDALRDALDPRLKN